MNISHKLRVVVLAAALGVLCWANARAQTVSLDSGGSFTYDGLTFAISGCYYAAAESKPVAPTTACSSAGLASTVVMEAVTSPTGGAAVEFLNTGSSGSILSMAKSSTNYAALLFTLTVTGSAKSLSSLSNAVTGTVSSPGPYACPETGAASCLTYSGGASGTLNTSPEGGMVTASFSPTNNLSISVVLGLAPVSNASSTLALNSATLTFTPAPEPASLGIFATGMVGIAAARRWRRRTRKSVRETERHAR